MTDRAGEQLDQYQLLRLLGQGAFGKVYLAEHLHQHTRVAIKVLTMQVTQEMLEEFLHEARVLFLLKHPSIIPLLDFGLANKTPFMVIEYAPHGTLRHRHPPGVRVPLEMVNTYVQQVASALQYAHEQRLIHRDVKPQNMLLNQQGQVLLSDFGIATIAHSEGSLATQGMAGTIPYMAPEQIQGKPRPASDQYALAICAYEWLCGVRPFSGSTVELIGQHLSADPPALRRHLPEMPEVIEEVVLHALAKDPQQRFASVAAFATAFQQAIWPQEHQRLRVPDVVSLLSLDPVDSSKTSPSPAVLPGEAHADNVTPLLSPSSEVPAPSGLPGTNIPSPPTEQHPALIAEKPAILHPFPRILTPPKSPHRRPFLVKVIALITALIVLAGGGLQFFFSFHHTTSSTALAGLPMLILSASVVRANQDASLHLANFLPRTTVVLTHDVQEPLLNTANTSSLITDASGQANSSFTLSNWTPGFHQIVAEDVTTRDLTFRLSQTKGPRTLRRGV